MPVRRSRRKAAKKPRSKSSLAPGAIGLGVAALAAVPASAASFNVTNLNDNGAGSLRDALIQANTTAGDDVVTFQAGLTGTITLTTGQLYISDSVDIQGPGAAVITVSGGGSSRVLYMYNSAATLNVRVAGLTITQGVALNGAGIVDFYENLTLDAVVVSGNNAQGVGGGVAVGGDDATQLTIQNSTITGNNASGGGGVYVYYADINISDSQITENNAEGGAGLLANGGYNGVGPLATIQISDTTFSGNDASGDGGGVFLYNGDVTFDTVTIDQNTSSGNGAGLHLDGFFLLLTIQDSTISGNIATGDGGGIYLEDTGGPATIDRTNITGNHANDDGGGIYFYDPDAAVTVSDSTMSGNTADDDGGAFNVYDTDGAPLTFQRTTISGNTAANSGGAFFFYEPDDAVVFENCTISGNTATTGSGGGIYFYNLYSGLALNFVTVAGNQAALDGGGVYLRNGIATINNSIAADNTSAGNMDLAGGGAFDLRFSLVEAPGSASINNITGNILGSDPALGALANNGGPTQTQRPGPASVVINAADPGIGPPPTTDQRGQPRFYPTRADMGAVEIVGGVIQFNPQNYQVQENGGSANLTVVRDVGPDPASASYTTNPGSATPGVGNDYTTTSGTVNFAAGDLSEPIVVPILDDNTVEGNEQFTVPLSNPSGGASIGAGNPANVTIVDVEPGQLVFSSATYSVGEQGGSVTITVNRINGSTGASSVQYTTNPGSATPGAGNDYTTTSGTLMWNDGDAAPKSFNVPILDDNAAEGNEQFTVTLSNPVNSTIGVPGTATVTITDDPAGTVQFSVATINTTEESGSVTVTVTRT
ncbi:MAG TPA: Calx-beta domain-containing protein, partial [Thermoanaerobaculia bacterium]|nr:Calx-beta domain-containing protein [Thermoanaerobaculia bacterium]